MGAKSLRRKLKKYNLRFEEALKYVHWNLEELNFLSEAVLKYTPFNEGEFYAKMPEGLSERQLYDFKGGCVKSYGIQDAIIEIVHSELIKNPLLVCIFDDFNEDYDPTYHCDLFDKVEVHYKKEVYLVVQSSQTNRKLLKDCFGVSDCIWHSLIIISETPYKTTTDKTISQSQLIELSKTAKLVLLRAYDQEGYIIWERNH